MSTDSGRWEFDAVAADGGIVHLRPVRPSDLDAYADLVRRVSSESRRFRFFTPRLELTDEELRAATQVDAATGMALVATLADEVIAIARYDRVGGSDAARGSEAEVAFLIDDAHRDRGIGTLMLEHLAVVARAEGIARFRAQVLPENRRMLRVFEDVGYELTTAFGDGVIEVEFPIVPTRRSVEVEERREHQADANSVARLLRPRSVAVVGATDRPGTIGSLLLSNLLDGGFDGAVHPVNPRYETLAGIACHPSVREVPRPVDLAVVAVPAPAVPGVVDDCAASGVCGLVVVSAGFSETGPEGAHLEADVLARARRGGMRMVGPNCLGVANVPLGLNATFALREPRPGNVGFLTQSGAIGIALAERAERLGLGLSSFVSVGNKADVSVNDLLQYWEDDPDTEVALLYIESFGNPRKFSRIARRVSRNKPVVAVKSARTGAGSRAAASHTAAAATPDAAVSALMRQTGVVRVDTLDELFAVSQVLASQPLPAGPRVAVVGNSGGPGILAADACERAGLEVPALSEETREALRGTLDPNASVANPVDMVASAGPEEYRRAMELVLADPGVDSIIVIFAPTMVADVDSVAEGVARAAAGSEKPVLANLLAGDGIPPAFAGGVGRRSVPVFASPEPAASALARVHSHASWRRRDPGTVPDLGGIDRAAARGLVEGALAGRPDGRWLDADEAVALLACYGVPVAEVHRAADADAAAALAAAIGGPVALKAASGELVHKSDVGGVRLDLTTPEQVREAFVAMGASSGGAIQEVVVQPMVASGVETIVGLVQDPDFGPLVMFGLGGLATELLADRDFRVLPLTDVDAAELVRGLRASALLFGYRGAPAVDTAALEDLLVRVGLLAEEVPEVVELDLNPVLARPDGVCAVDVKVRLAPYSRRPHGRRLEG